MGEWFADIPPVNRVRVLDSRGRPVPDTTRVRLFFDTDASYTGHAFDNSHSAVLSPSQSTVQLPADPFATHGSIPLAGHNLLLIEVRTATDDAFCFQEPTSFNMVYWLGYRDAAHPATYVLRLGREADNGCNLTLPPALINEPFATSPDASRLALGPAGTASRRSLMVQLLDDASPPHSMRNREVEVLGTSSRVLGRGITDRRGILNISLPAGARTLAVWDRTDNNLRITAPLENRSASKARRP
jgi:hypothetical protein